MTKLDVLSAWDRIPVCVAYEIDGVRHAEMPMTQSEFHKATPVYEHLDGWGEDISGCRTFEDLPKNAQRYVHRARGDVWRPVLGGRGRTGSRADARGVLETRHSLADTTMSWPSTSWSISGSRSLMKGSFLLEPTMARSGTG